MNDIEKEALVERLKQGRINNFKKYGKVGGKGKGMPGKAPFGYYWLDDELMTDEEKAIWVRRIFKWRQDGLSYRKIAARLNECGVTTNTGKPFNRQSIMNILKNRFYFGELHYSNKIIENHHQQILN